VNVENRQNQPIAELFGVQELPGVYLFDFKKMKKNQIHPDAFASTQKLEEAISAALRSTIKES
jgi:thioredoxin-like negative regulator of GroEL